MDRFLHSGMTLDLSTVFPGGLVEKPVENVENSCGNVESDHGNVELCQLVTFPAGFYRKDICFHCEYSENNPVFVGNIENTPLLLGKLMVSSEGWRNDQLSTALSSVVGESCISQQYTTRPYLAMR